MTRMQAELLAPTEYLAQATTLANAAQSRIYLISLSIFRDNATSDLMDAIIAAARRGVEVHVAADFLTFVYALKSLHPLGKFLTGSNARAADKVRIELEKAGAKFYWLGRHNVPFFIGRTHSKWCVIDDTVFSFGGVNIEKAATERADYMFKIKNAPLLADALVNEQRRIEKANKYSKTLHNHSIKTDLGTVMFDSGQVGQSLIYNHAIKLVNESESVLFVSQYCPSGKLGESLRNKHARTYFNPKSLADGLMNRFMIGSKHMIREQHNLYQRNRYIHAKFIIGTLPDGSKRAITGSHNFATAGAHLGTREIALETTDNNIIRQLEHFYHYNIE